MILSQPHHFRIVLCRFIGLVACFAAMSVACGPPLDADVFETSDTDTEPPARWLELLDPGAWSATAAVDDPWRHERPDTPVCPVEESWRVEAGGLEVDTGACDYLSVSQPLVRAITAGQPLRVTAWWQNLIAEDLGQGHLAVSIDGEVVWEEWVDIPGPADAREIEVAAPADAEPGALVTLHLHNHGANTWRFQGLALGLPEN